MVVFPNAKINIGLNIISKRNDGFHNLESCFFPIPWTDALEILHSETFSFTSSGIIIPGDTKSNLCIAAYDILRTTYSLPPVQIHLHKNIPIGAGMGGGSSDAAFTIKVLNIIFDLKLSDDLMEEYARRLGSDCAFFIKNKPVLAIEKGDVFEEIEINLTGKFLFVIYPEVHISTKEAYAGVVPKAAVYSIREITQLPVEEWKTHLHNDFEDSLFQSYLELQKIKEALYKAGAQYASMTGSGSALYGIFESGHDLEKLFPRKNFKIFQL